MDIEQLRSAIVVDFEAVPGVTGTLFPTEIGVASGARHAASYLAPDPAWLPAKPSWEGHRGSLEGATREGRPLARVADWFVGFAHGRTLLSDACFVDQPLLDLVLGGRRDGIGPLVPFFPAFDACSASLGVPRSVINGWISEIDETRGPPHRAGEDARVRALLVARLARHADANGGP